MLSVGQVWSDVVDSRTNHYVGQWMRHFPLLRTTCVEQWIDKLQEVSPPTWLRALTSAERDLLVDAHWRRQVGRRPPEPSSFDHLVVGLEEMVLRAQEVSSVGAAFVRLGFRAPVDSPMAQEGELQVDGGPEALVVLLDSERVFDDLCLSQECGYTPSLIVRPWLDIPAEAELRAFVRGRKLVGISQRRLEGPLAGLIGQVPLLERSVKERCEELADRWPLDDLVVDFACLDDEEATVLDLHPWLPWSDGALFDWEQDAFEAFSFRYLQ